MINACPFGHLALCSVEFRHKASFAIDSTVGYELAIACTSTARQVFTAGALDCFIIEYDPVVKIADKERQRIAKTAPDRRSARFPFVIPNGRRALFKAS